MDIFRLIDDIQKVNPSTFFSEFQTYSLAESHKNNLPTAPHGLDKLV
jgi:hypothetical protein